jgi:hypothetical protein
MLQLREIGLGVRALKSPFLVWHDLQFAPQVRHRQIKADLPYPREMALGAERAGNGAVTGFALAFWPGFWEALAGPGGPPSGGCVGP